MTEHRGNTLQRRIRVMLVEDSATELYLLQKVFALAPDMEVVACARNGREALDLLPQVKPDVVCTDYQMPVMNGLEFIIKAMKQYPCAIVVLSVAVQSFQKDNIFKLLSAGAVDVLAKPLGQAGGLGEQEGRQLLDKIRAIAQSPALRLRLATATTAATPVARVMLPSDGSRVGMVAIGASTGGPQILQRILSQLPRQFAAPLVCVQHISEGFLDGMIGWLQSSCSLKLGVAQQGMTPQVGHVYFAPNGHHLALDAHRRFKYVARTALDLHCPRVDDLMQSVAKAYGESALGVLLSGMGRDGARGLKAMRDAGAPTIAQDEATSVIFGMPAAAIELGAAKYVLSTDDIAAMMVRLGGSGTASGRLG